MTDLRANGLTLAYDRAVIVDGLTVAIPPGWVTALVGPNGCGKSTLLRGLARLLRPRSGAVYLDGKEIVTLPTRQVARKLGILPQGPTAPEGLTVRDLVAQGRSPHRSLLRAWSHDDEAAVQDALTVTDTLEFADRPVETLSGGQRQRAWIAMALAQQTDILLLDEPTTFLDLAHQVEVLDLLADLNARQGRTVVMVIHDLNQACRYADHLIAMRAGAIVAEGPPGAVVSEAMVDEVFGIACRIIVDPVAGTPLCVPRGGRRLPAANGKHPAGAGMAQKE
jgi:iron complex transport system ATP-binding protein